MDQATFGKQLQAARKLAGYRSQADLADVIGISARTIRNYENDKTRPDAGNLALLRQALGDFEEEGDRVESALRHSELRAWRQNAVISEYQRHLEEQRREEASA